MVIDRCIFLVFPSMQCPVHQLCGYGVSDWTSSHRQSHFRNHECQSGTLSHDCSLQGVGTRHHTHRQPEKVSSFYFNHSSFNIWTWFISPYLSFLSTGFSSDVIIPSAQSRSVTLIHRRGSKQTQKH